jgi:hypothetical protein
MAVLDWDPTPYPDPRKNRKGVQKGGDPTETPEVIVPRVRVWQFNLMSSTATHRVFATSPLYRGPALIKCITLQWQAVSTAGQTAPVMSLRWAESYAASVGVVLWTQPTGGTAVVEQSFVRTDTVSAPRQDGWVPMLASQTGGPHTWPLNYPITVPEFKLAAAIDVAIASPTDWSGQVLVYEQIDPRYVGRFMN